MRNTARRVIPLRETVRRSAKPRAKKSTPSFPPADQVAQVITQLQTLLRTGEAAKVDGELKDLLQALGLDPESPAAWRDGFLLLGAMYCGIGKPRRTNTNAEKLSADDDWALLHEMIRLKDRGCNQEQAIGKLASDPSKTDLLKFKATSSKAQRVEALSKRVSAMKKKSVGLENIWGTPSVTTVEEALINQALAEVGKTKVHFEAFVFP
jgi:hypothetical protein